MPILVEIVFSEWTSVTINLVLSFAVDCYDTVKNEVVIFFIYSLEFYIGFYFEFTFLLLY